MLRSRGFSGGKLIAAQGFQAAFTAIVAYPLGLLLGMGLAALASRANGPSLPGVLFPIGLSPLALVLGLIGAAAGAVTLLLLSLPHVRRTILEERRLLSREDRPFLVSRCRSRSSCCRSRCSRSSSCAGARSGRPRPAISSIHSCS